MRRVFGAVIGILLITAGCGQQQPPRESASVPKLAMAPQTPGSRANTSRVARQASASLGDNRIIARANGEPITMSQFMKPLVEAHGLQILMGVVQLELAKQDIRSAHLIVSPEDIRNEREMTLSEMFRDADTKENEQLEEARRTGKADLARQIQDQIHSDREQLLNQYLTERNFSPTEFDIKIEINAYLRKLAEPMLRGKITDDMVRQEFGVEYGETARVRYIQLANMEEEREARRRLQSGEDFSEVARQMSRDRRTAELGGEMMPFSRQTTGIPDAFKQLAFSLQPGQVSDALNVLGSVYILKLEQKLAPKAVKFEDVQEGLRKGLMDRAVHNLMQQLYSALGGQAQKTLRIEDPMLSKVYEDFKSRQEAAIRDRQKLNEQWKHERQRLLEPATQPSAAPTTAPATQPAAVPTTVPATQP